MINLKHWDTTRELFTDWVANNPLRDDLREITWQGMSIWWALSPTQKIVESEDSWYKRLHNAIHNKPNFQIEKKTGNAFQSLLKALLNNLFIKLVYRDHPKYKFDCEYVWFHSLSYNFSENDQGSYYDRLYSKSIDLDLINHKKSAYIIKYYSNNRFSYQKWISERKKLKKLTRPFWICDKYINLFDICNIYIISFYYKIKVLKAIKKNKNIFVINGFDYHNVLRPFLLESFSGHFQESLIYAQAMQSFYKKNGILAPKIITYGELLPFFRSVCHVLKMSPIIGKIITIQHAYSNKNKLPSYHRWTEFDNSSANISPRPDLFLVQGKQYLNIVKEYIPEKDIKVIGCLKYDNFYHIKNQWEIIRNRTKKLIKLPDEKKTVLIAPSVGDFQMIIHFLKHSKEIKKFNILLSPHPSIRDSTLYHFKNKLQISVYAANLSTIELISISDLVVAGISVICLESQFFGVDSIRLSNEIFPPQYDASDGISTVNNVDQFDEYLAALYGESKRVTRSLALENFFYRLDGLTGKRLWYALSNYN